VRLRERGALEEARAALAEEILYHIFVQYRFERQWRELREHCHTRDVGLIGDIPIFVAYDSSDVWAHRELFLLDKHGRPTVVSGAPPDAFTFEGQKWNHPHYRWEAHRAEGYAWWAARFAAMARHFDGVRIDHFLGFNRAWEVPARAKNARRGKWLAGPGEELFRAVRRKVGRFPIIAEDLGALTPEAVALREKLGFPGMRILQMGLGGDGRSEHVPHNYVPGCVAYTGTHDNHTAVGWFRSLGKGSAERERALAYVGGDERRVHWEMVRAVITSVANTAVFPVQDLLGLGDDARMNVPGVDRGNWRWRLEEGALTTELAGELRRLTEVAGRV
jgi:4-alpha-glucanotransferase